MPRCIILCLLVQFTCDMCIPLTVYYSTIKNKMAPTHSNTATHTPLTHTNEQNESKDYYRIENDHQESSTSKLLKWAIHSVSETASTRRFTVDINTIMHAGHVNMNKSLLPVSFAIDSDRLSFITETLANEQLVNVHRLSPYPFLLKYTYCILKERFQFSFNVHGTYDPRSGGTRAPILMFPMAILEDVQAQPTKRKIGQIPRLMASFAMAAMDSPECLIVFIDARRHRIIRGLAARRWLPYRRRLVAHTNRIFLRNTGYIPGPDEDPDTVREKYCFLPFDVFVETLVLAERDAVVRAPSGASTPVGPGPQ